MGDNNTGNSTSTAIPVGQLIDIIYASDPDLPQYNPQSAEYAEFPEALQRVSQMGKGAVDAASVVALAIKFPRPDAYLAAQTLLAFGPEITATVIPVLLDNLHSPEPKVRIYSIMLLGSIGNKASCAVGNIAPMLWDSDPGVRTASGLALDNITGNHLVSSEYKLNLTPSFLASAVYPDDPQGLVIGSARSWWGKQGSRVNWHPSYDICDP